MDHKRLYQELNEEDISGVSPDKKGQPHVRVTYGTRILNISQQTGLVALKMRLKCTTRKI